MSMGATQGVDLTADTSAHQWPSEDTPPKDITIVGGGVAACRCAFELRNRGYKGDVRVVTAESQPPYDRTLLSKDMLSAEDPQECVPLASFGTYKEHQIDLHTSSVATALDPAARQITLSDGSVLPYDRLILAVGGKPTLPADLDAPGVLVVREAAQLPALRDALVRSRHLLLIGGGFVGGEVAAAATTQGAAVTMLEAAQQPLEAVLGAEVGARVAERHRAHGVEIKTGSTAKSVEEWCGGYRVTLADGSTIDADTVVVGVGMRPNTDWLLDSGVRLQDGILTDASCRTSAPGVFAAGDCARWWNPRYGRLCRVEHWHTAGEHGAAAAQAALGQQPNFAPLPFFWSDQYDVKYQWVGDAPSWDNVRVEEHGPNSFVAQYYRQDELIAAFAANQPRKLAALRRDLLRERPVKESMTT